MDPQFQLPAAGPAGKRSMTEAVSRKIIDLEWPTRYLLECGHEVRIAPDASVADMAMPGQLLVCPACGGAAGPQAPTLVTPFKAGEAINAMTLNDRLREIETCLRARGVPLSLTPFAAEEPINAETLNRRLEAINQAMSS
jgi:hypothetical protein